MTKICLIRHGETEWNASGRMQGKTDIPLNKRGIQQAKDCGASLDPSRYDVIITSPLKRAKQTAEIINEYLNLSLHEMPAFAERSFGDAEGLTLEERKQLYPDRNYPNQEERDAFNERVMHAMQSVHDQFPTKHVLVVAHGAVINQILSTITDGEIGSGKTKLLNTCINNIDREADSWKVIDYNIVHHLAHTM